MVFTTLAHHIDLELLREAYRRTRKDGAVGVDGQTAETYVANLEDNLRSLLDRFKSGAYRAPPVRRVYIPKADGTKLRPIGIPAFEDKILQRAVAMVLEAVYEQDFMDCSYGFRPRRSAHQALTALRQRSLEMNGGWVLDADIKAFFDTLDHAQLRAFLDQRVRDGVLRRAIGKWLNAGVLEEGAVTHPDAGTPQGGVISPLLANIYLHEVLDRWFEFVVKPRLEGDAFLVRYADDFVIVFTSERDARRVLDVLPKRFGKHGLTLHPEKTRLVPFRRPRKATVARGTDDDARPGTYDFLGFTHYWGKSRWGRWVIKHATARSRMSRAIKTIDRWCRNNRHRPIPEQHKVLKAKLDGHCGYYGLPGNSHRLAAFRFQLLHAWQKWLNRRSQRARMWWHRFRKVMERYPLLLPPPSRRPLAANP